MADFAEFYVIWQQRKAEVALWLLPFLGTLVIGIDAGLLGSLAVCTLLVINHASLAHATLQVALTLPLTLALTYPCPSPYPYPYP